MSFFTTAVTADQSGEVMTPSFLISRTRGGFKISFDDDTSLQKIQITTAQTQRVLGLTAELLDESDDKISTKVIERFLSNIRS